LHLISAHSGLLNHQSIWVLCSFSADYERLQTERHTHTSMARLHQSQMLSVILGHRDVNH